MLGRQILDFLVEANQLSPRKRKKLEECLEDMEKQIRFREEATCNLPNLFAMQIETLHRYLVITERIGMYGGAVSASSRKIRRLIKRFEGLVRKPLRRQGKDFGLPDILTAVVED